MFGWKGFGWGGRRWMVASMTNDPERAYFGLGPCGEYMYRLYKEGKIEKPADWYPGYGQESILKAIEELKRKIEELERRIK